MSKATEVLREKGIFDMSNLAGQQGYLLYWMQGESWGQVQGYYLAQIGSAINDPAADNKRPFKGVMIFPTHNETGDRMDKKAGALKRAQQWARETGRVTESWVRGYFGGYQPARQLAARYTELGIDLPKELIATLEADAIERQERESPDKENKDMVGGRGL